jgi:hypothetical protein
MRLIDIQITDLDAPRYQNWTGAIMEVLTTTVFPLVYRILSLLALSFVDTPRAVVGVAAYMEAFLKDIVAVDLQPAGGSVYTIDAQTEEFPVAR